MLKRCQGGRGTRGHGAQPKPAGTSSLTSVLPLRSHLGNRNAWGHPMPPHVQQKEMEGEIRKGGNWAV